MALEIGPRTGNILFLFSFLAFFFFFALLLFLAFAYSTSISSSLNLNWPCAALICESIECLLEAILEAADPISEKIKWF
jgi:hypothetical protein